MFVSSTFPGIPIGTEELSSLAGKMAPICSFCHGDHHRKLNEKNYSSAAIFTACNAKLEPYTSTSLGYLLYACPGHRVADERIG